MGFHPETEALELHTKEILTRESTAEETPFQNYGHSLRFQLKISALIAYL